MKQHLFLTLLLVLAAWTPLSLSQANGDWSLRAAGEQGIFSPDHRFVAYRYVPAAFTHALTDLQNREGGVAGYTNAYDIGITNLESGEEIVIAGQPADASYFAPNAQDNYRMRSNPTWSPDGTKVVWTSNGEDVGVPADALAVSETGWFHLVVYDVTTRQMSIIATGLDQAHLISTIGPDLLWTEAGVSLLYNNDFQYEVITVSPEGELVSRVLTEQVEQYIPIQQGGQVFIAANDLLGEWMLIDPKAGTLEHVDAVPVMYSTLAPDTSLGVYSRKRPDNVQNWYVVLPDGTSQRLDFVPKAISPDGTQIAYQRGANEALAWSGGQPEQPLEFPGSGAWAWGPTTWRMMPGISGREVMSAGAINPTPLLMTIAGELFAWQGGDETPVQLTDLGGVSLAIISPDRSRAVFRSNVGPVVGSAFRTYREVWLLDMNTFEATPIIELTETGVEASRMSPTWSPDGSQLAFLELTMNDEQRLVVYNVQTDTYEIIVPDLPAPSNVFDMWAAWDDPGIAVVFRRDGGGTEVRIYQADGTLISSATFRKDEIGTLLYLYWVSTPDGAAMLDIIHGDGSTLIDPTTGESTDYEGELQIYAEGAGSDSVWARWMDGQWYAHMPDGREDPLGFGLRDITMFTLSGQEFAYSQYGKALVWRDGQVMQVPPTGREIAGARPLVAWGPVQFRLGESRTTPAQDDQDVCGDAQPSRLQVGQPARVVVGDGANNVRSTPGTKNELVGQIPEGEQFTVLQGPACVENMFWWRVDYDGLTGWTAEGNRSAYWLEPLGG